MLWRSLASLSIFLQAIILGGATKNSIIGINTECNQDEMVVSLLFENDFDGVVYSRGGSRRCNATGQLSRQLSINMVPDSCSLRIHKEDNKLVYSTVIQVQMSPSLQQVNDPSFPVSCKLNADMLNLNAKNLKVLTNNRTGRGMSSTARAWMEVKGSAISGFTNSLTVGEHTTLTIYTSLPEGVESSPVDCAVHDGQGTRQAIVDARGCPVDPGVVPSMRWNPRAAVWITAFPAFSFPDSPLVHYVCRLMLCRTSCPKVDCTSGKNGSRSGRDIPEEEKKNVLDIVELYNSVEVTAPNIELGYLKRQYEEILEGGGGEGALCTSAPRLAVGFAVLGGVFLTAIVASLCSMLSKRRSHSHFHVLRPASPASLWSLRI